MSVGCNQFLPWAKPVSPDLLLARTRGGRSPEVRRFGTAGAYTPTDRDRHPSFHAVISSSTPVLGICGIAKPGARHAAAWQRPASYMGTPRPKAQPGTKDATYPARCATLGITSSARSRIE